MPPTTTVTAFGFDFFTASDPKMVRLPVDKRDAYLLLVRVVLQKYRSAQGHVSFRVNDIESLAGKLLHAALVVRAGWTFARRLLDSMKFRQSHHKLRLSDGAFRDLLFWERALVTHKCRPLPIIVGLVPSPQLVCYSDATPEMCAFVVGDDWFQYYFRGKELLWHINKKEVHAIVLGTYTFEARFSNIAVNFKTDSHGTVVGAKRMLVSDPLMMDAYRHL